MNKFEVCKIEIDGKNLIEASAGTGKTYSIALLVIRLLLEKSISLEKMLIVTFTNAAVAELDIRIRKFLHQAYNIVRNKSEDEEKNSDLDFIVKKSISSIGQQKTEELIRNAILFLDEISIFTIHGFCQVTLTDNAFESGLLFNSDIIEDQTEIIEMEAYRYWRSNVTILDKNLLKVLMEKDFSPELIVKVFSEVNSGKKLRIKNLYSIDELPGIIVSQGMELNYKISDLKQRIFTEWENLKVLNIKKNTNIGKALKNDSIDDFYNELIIGIKKNTLAVINEFGFLNGEEIIRAEEEYDLLKTDTVSIILNDAVSKIAGNVELIKNRNRVLSFNDMISKLHNALVKKENRELYRKLNNRYQAVFIDEFQDTDLLQYEIFKKAFGEDSKAIVFFIGDPKQSIYGWRGADLEMYAEAKKSIKPDKFFNMESNFRSTPKLLQSINKFFKAGEDSHPPENNTRVNEFVYFGVKAGNNELGELMDESTPSHPFEIINDSFEKNKWLKIDQLLASAAEIAQMLKTHSINNEKIKPNDIGVLCRRNEEARKFKELLTMYNIPSVIVDDTKIIDTKEATDLYYLLFGILNINESNISRALLNSFTGYTTAQIQNLNLEKHYDIFYELQKTWKNSGIFSLIIEFINRYNIRNYLIFSNNLNGERVYTNLMQLTQILNEKEIYDKLSPERLLDWFQKARQGEKSFNKYEQQIESDEDSVQIVTVHKSKGLAYKVVILPYFNLEARTVKKDKIPFIDYREDSLRIISFYWEEYEKELKKKQEVEENRRLLYVAITRAVYKCILNYGKNSNGILNEYINKIKDDKENFVFRSAVNPDQRYQIQNNKKQVFVPLKFGAGVDKSWSVTSFSNLNYMGETHKTFSDPEIDHTDPYDKFVFSDLKKGAQMGLIIHEILERLNFDKSESRKKLIVSVLKKYTGNTEEKYTDYIELMIQIALNTKLHPLDFSIADVSSERTLKELEFYFSIDKFKSDKINSLIPGLNLSYSEMRGIMHGFIDLIFEHEGQFYILDWKTNHLGYNTQDYDEQRLEQIIKDNNYHLQYLIYTIALKRYLTVKVPGFSYAKHFGGVLYLFLRGIRTGHSNGIYFKKPDESLIIELEKMMHP